MHFYYVGEAHIFPHPRMVKSSGILAVGGDLDPDRLMLAYQYGIYPWFNEGEPVIWWCPAPRFVIFPDRVKVARSMRPYFNQQRFRVTYNQHFTEVMRFCQFIPRHGQEGTWITEDIVHAYTALFHQGNAMSVEVWEGENLVGGLYGVIIGKVFFGESMFSVVSNASRFGFITLAKRLAEEGFQMIDCQQPNPYLASLGGEFLSGEAFYEILRKNRLTWLQGQ